VANSILDNIVATLQALQDPAFTVERKLPTYEELQSFAATQLPVIAVVAELPRPQRFVWRPNFRGKYPGFLQAETELVVYLHVYDLENVSPNTKANTLTGKVWTALMADTTREGLAERTEVIPRDIGYIKPYVMLIIEVHVFYRHGAGSI
jgi:hypothetical protein